jgi:ATP-dependent helicase HepA
VERFLAPTPIRFVVSHRLEDVSDVFGDTPWERKLQKASPYKLIENTEIAGQTLPSMLQKAARLAETHAAALRQLALKDMDDQLGHEVHRLQTLRQVNDHVRVEEIQLAQAQQTELQSALQQSRIRLDSLRLIWKGPVEALS